VNTPAIPRQRLTAREVQILQATTEGESLERIGALLRPPLAEGTVRTHLRSVHRKLQARSTAQAVLIAYADGWLPVPQQHSAQQQLTPSERELLHLLAHGHTAASAARELGCGERALAYRLENIYRELGAKNRVHAIRLAVASGDLPLTPAPDSGHTTAAHRLLTDTSRAATVRTGARRPPETTT
jgi:DNA-binding NarL/FixJ family response regulator